MFKLAWRLFYAGLRRGELWIIFAAISLSVASVWIFSSVTAQVEQAIFSKSADFMAADRVLRSGHPLSLPLAEQAQLHHVDYAEQLVFPTMVFAQEQMQLANVKAVSDNYPLRGRLVLQSAQGEVVNAKLSKGQAYVAERLFYQLGIGLGDSIEIGLARFTVVGKIVREPDAPFSVFATAPRVIISLDSVSDTQVVQPHSRLSYRYLFAGSASQLASFEAWLKPKLEAGWRYTDIRSDDSPLASALDRAERFLLLAALVGITLASTAIAVAARLYCQRNYDTVAIIKLLGASLAQVRRVYLLQLALLLLSALAVGLLLAKGLSLPLAHYLGQSLALDLAAQPTGAKPYLIAIACGVVCGCAFTLPTLLQLFAVQPLRVIQRFHLPQLFRPHWVVLWLSLSIFVLMLLYSGSWLLSLLLFAGGALLVVLVLFLSHVLIALLRRISSKRAPLSFTLASSSLYRNSASNKLQLVGYSVAIMLGLLIYIVQAELIAQWQNQLKDDAPNHFLLNIDDAQVAPLQRALNDAKLQASFVYPMVRGRLVAINGTLIEHAQATVRDDFDEKPSRQSRAPDRELNLSSIETLPNANTLFSGTWFDGGLQQASLEREFAKRSGIELGDTLLLRIGGIERQARVTSLREVDWNSMQPNFFILLSKDVLEGLGQSYMTAFYLPKAQSAWLSELLARMPNLVVIDVAALVAQLQSVIDQVSKALKLILLIVILASLLVLQAQVQASLAERNKQMVVLRTLGAAKKLLQATVLIEFTLLGLLGGFIAALVAQVVLFGLQYWLFEVPLAWAGALWLYGPLSGALVIASLGAVQTLWQLRRTSNHLVKALA